jgi:hypothetical protein
VSSIKCLQANSLLKRSREFFASSREFSQPNRETTVAVDRFVAGGKVKLKRDSLNHLSGQFMSRSKPKLSFAAAGSRPKLVISKADWERIEAAYGHVLPDAVRRKVRAAAREFLDWASFETAAATKAEAIARVQFIQKAARNFREQVFLCPPGIAKHADFYARHLICRSLGLKFEGGQDGLQNLAFRMERNIFRGCDRALAQLRGEAAAKIQFRAGMNWDAWIRQLGVILSEHQLPITVRKDSAKARSSKPSAFVAFVRELQACVPKDYWRSPALRSDVDANAALSTAIARARRVTKTSPVSQE